MARGHGVPARKKPYRPAEKKRKEFHVEIVPLVDKYKKIDIICGSRRLHS